MFIELEHRQAIIAVLDLGIRSDVRADHVFRRRSFENAVTLETSRRDTTYGSYDIGKQSAR